MAVATLLLANDEQHRLALAPGEARREHAHRALAFPRQTLGDKLVHQAYSSAARSIRASPVFFTDPWPSAMAACGGGGC
jgi:hypothetical protein